MWPRLSHFFAPGVHGDRQLERHRGNVTRAAEEMGTYRQHLQVKIAKLGIDLRSFR